MSSAATFVWHILALHIIFPDPTFGYGIFPSSLHRFLRQNTYLLETGKIRTPLPDRECQMCSANCHYVVQCSTIWQCVNRFMTVMRYMQTVQIKNCLRKWLFINRIPLRVGTPLATVTRCTWRFSNLCVCGGKKRYKAWQLNKQRCDLCNEKGLQAEYVPFRQSADILLLLLYCGAT